MDWRSTAGESANDSCDALQGTVRSENGEASCLMALWISLPPSRRYIRNVPQQLTFISQRLSLRSRSERLWHLKLTAGYPLTRQLRIKYGSYRIHSAASPEYLEIWLRGRFTAPQISINQPEGNYPLGLQTRVGDLRNDSSTWPVFVRAGASPFGIVEAVLQSASLLNAAQRLLKEPRETLHIHNEGVNLYFKPSSVKS